ncbi:tape measure domain-containing protein [Fontibacillus phaseoli]|uniref:Tape measure domain-containing protein n=1 Tax=Fontibacillus phaseoli TaxID=1416533 RepID=A0A369BM17_9BACL|nr:tape measure protein [Fontibacillus phaseoli]RCX22593.1 tape measure domain-containing protein [Fontibacillus phaseoli]
MTTMSTALQLYDGTSTALQMYDGLSSRVQSYSREVSQASSLINGSVTRTAQLFLAIVPIQMQVAAAQTEIQKSTEGAEEAQSSFGDRIKKMGTNVVDVFKKAKSAVDQLKPAMDFSDAYVNTFYRLDSVNDKLQTSKQLHDKVFAAAQRSRGDYMSMASSVAEMGKAAPKAFKTNDEMIAFQELLNKSYKVEGKSESDQKSGTGKLTQVMAAGKFQGSDFSSMTEYAPMLADAVSKYTGKTKQELQALSGSGALSSDVIKNAMFSATDEINGKFSQVPKTFSDHFTSLKNTAIRNLDPIISKVSEILNSPAVASFMTGLQTGLNMVFSLFDPLIAGAEQFAGVLQNNLPIVWGLLSGISAFLIGLAMRQIPNLIIGLWNMIPPLITQAITWLAINWPILLIAALIGILVAALMYFGVSAQEVVGVVFAVFYALYANIYNIIALLYNLFASYAEFLINLFIDPVYAIKKLFYDLVMTFGNFMYNMLRSAEDFAGGFMKTILAGINGALKGFNWLVEKVNGIFGTDFATAQLLDETNIHALSDKFKGMMDVEAPVSDKSIVSLKRMEYKNINEFSKKGYSGGLKFSDQLKNGAGKIGDKFKNPAGELDVSASPFAGNSFGAGSASNIPNVGKVDRVGGVDEEVAISSEDLKMMRELAEMKSIQNFVSLTPTVQVTTGPVTNGADIDTIVAKIEQSLDEEISSSAAGVYA